MRRSNKALAILKGSSECRSKGRSEGGVKGQKKEEQAKIFIFYFFMAVERSHDLAIAPLLL